MLSIVFYSALFRRIDIIYSKHWKLGCRHRNDKNALR